MVDRALGQEKRPWKPPGGSALVWVFLFDKPQGDFLLGVPSPSSWARRCTVKACEGLTSCLSVSLAMISLWSMSDSSSTSSSD